MNVNPLILGMRTALGVDIFPDVYVGDDGSRPNEYITFTYDEDRPAFFADDDDVNYYAAVTVSWFCRTDQQTKKRKLRNALKAAGFRVTSTNELYENDTGFTHIAVSAWIVGPPDESESETQGV